MTYQVEDKHIFKLHKVSLGNVWGTLIFCVCLYLCVFMLAFSMCFSSSYVYGESMKPTINNYADYEHNQDIVYVNKNAKLVHGDIVVIQKTSSKKIVKRVIALPGDTIDIVQSGGRYYVERNGVKLDEDAYINVISGLPDYNGMYRKYNEFQNYKETHRSELDFVDPVNWENSAIKVGENQLFVLGDNRHNSEDSSQNGCFSMDSVEGRVDVIIYAGQNTFFSLLKYFYWPF